MSQMTAFFRSLQGGYLSVRASWKHSSLIGRLLSSVKALGFIGTNPTFQMCITWVSAEHSGV